MVTRHTKRKVEERPTREMAKDELLGLLSEAEREVARRKRAGTTLQPIAPPAAPAGELANGTIDDDLEVPLAAVPEHSPLPISGDQPVDDGAFSIDTRELDARVFRSHALDTSRASGRASAIGSGQSAPIAAAAPSVVAPEPAAIEVAPSRGRARLFVATAAISVAVTAGVLLASQFLK